MSENLTPPGLQRLRQGVIIGLELAIEEIKSDMTNAQSTKAIDALETIRAKLNVERLRRIAELKMMLDGDA